MSAYITDVDLFDVTSSISTPFYQISLPEGDKISAQFVYNYYTRNEGVSEKVFLDPVDAESDQYRFVMENWENGVFPRQVNLSFRSLSSYPSTTLDPGILTNAVRSEKIIYEDAPFSSRFSGVSVHDTSIDEKIYLSFSESDREDPSERSRDFLNVSKLQSSGYRFSKAQTRQGISDLYDQDVKSINLSISINNLFVADVLRTAAVWQSSAFADEFATPIEESQILQDRSRASDLNPFLITEDELDVELKVVDSRRIRSIDVFTSPTAFLETLRPEKIGYIIEKYGEQVDGSTRRYDDIVIESPIETSYTDAAVRYGATYKYRIRTVYRTYVISPSKSDGSVLSDFYEICTIFVASTGAYTSVECEEKIPPLPPVNISFQQTLSGLYIRWNFPINTQKDIKRFQLFRRSNTEEPFQLLKEINFDQTILPYTSGERVPKKFVQSYTGPVKNFTDSDFSDINSDYIYAICSIDAHGYSSAYSEQFRVRFDKITGKLLITRISAEGAPKPYPNVKLLGDFFSDLIKDSGHSRIRIYFDPEYSDVTRGGKSLSLISSGEIGSPNYKFNLTEINLGKSQTFDIYMNKSNVSTAGIPVSIARFYTAD